MIFITGATGLLGTRLVYDLRVKGHRLRLLRRGSSDIRLFLDVLRFYHGSTDIEHLLEGIDWLEGDVLDPLLLDAALAECSHCIHAAAMVSFHPRDKYQMYTINVLGTSHVVNACLERGVRLCHVSSVAALGRTGERTLINEQANWKDSPHNTAYAISKYNSELEVWRGVEEGLDAVIVNPSIIIGAGSSRASSGTLFGVVEDGLKYYTDGHASVVDVRDVSAMSIALCLGAIGASRYILSAETLPYRSVFERIAKSLGRKAPHKRASRWMLSVAWRLAWVKDVVTQSKSPISKETARSSESRYFYENVKVKTELGLEFKTATEAIDYHARFYSAA